MLNKKERLYILISVLLFPLLLIIILRSFSPASSANYLISSIYKLIFITPLVLRPLFSDVSLKNAFLKHISLDDFKKNYKKAFWVGIGLGFIYLLHYLLFRGMFSSENISEKLGNTASITAQNIIFIGLFIIIINSFLEEFFWRGFAFNELDKLMKPWQAHLITGLAFSFHHVVFYYNWFDPIIFSLVTIGLILYAIFMNLFFKRFHDLLSCWFIHAIVDIVQIGIAFSIFGLI